MGGHDNVSFEAVESILKAQRGVVGRLPGQVPLVQATCHPSQTPALVIIIERLARPDDFSEAAIEVHLVPSLVDCKT